MIFPQVELIASFSFIVTSFFCLQVPPSFAETLLDFNEIGAVGTSLPGWTWYGESYWRERLGRGWLAK